jgi:hypothetical protein
MKELRLGSQRFFTLDDLANLPHPKWRIDGLFDVNSLVMVAGPASSFKSFLVLDWSLSMVTGRPWCDRETAPGKVLYLLGEGKSGFLKRVAAWCDHYAPSPDEEQLLRENFRVSFEVPQLAVNISVKDLLRDLRVEEFTPNVIVIDTFARSFVGMDENSPQDTGLWVEAADKLRQRGFTVIFLHHTKKNTEFGLHYRGSTAIMGAMDTAFTLQRDKTIPNKVVLNCTKQKDHIEPPPIWLERSIVRPASGSEGSIVLTPALAPNEEEVAESKEQRLYTDGLIEDLLGDESYVSDRNRAKALAQLIDVSEAAAQQRISRKRRAKS